MTGNIAIDIFIGLVFIYLLYSLLTTLLTEIIVTHLDIRARNLKIAIIKMLSDNKIKPTIKDDYVHFWKKGITGDDKNLAVLFYQSPLIKHLGTSAFSSKPSSISPKMFSDAVISILGKGDKSLIDNVKSYFAANSSQHNSEGETFEQLRFYYEDANKDIERFREKLEYWYNEMLNRSKEWYKQRIQIILLIVGLIITTIFNVDTFEITRKLSKDSTARQYFVQAASQVDFSENENLNHKSQDLKHQALDSLFQESFKVQEILSISRCNNDCGIIAKYWYSSFYNFLGCFLSALALSLGAPFWYDLLNKLMQLRASVTSKNQQGDNDANTTPKVIKG